VSCLRLWRRHQDWAWPPALVLRTPWTAAPVFLAALTSYLWRKADRLPYLLIAYWITYSLISLGPWSKAGVHFDSSGRVLATPEAPVDDPPAALLF
jgi:hypothetical protein